MSENENSIAFAAYVEEYERDMVSANEECQIAIERARVDFARAKIDAEYAMMEAVKRDGLWAEFIAWQTEQKAKKAKQDE